MKRDTMHRKALVLGSDTRSALSVIRSLGRGGVQIHVAWHEKDSPALRSRYVFRAHDLPPYDADDDAWQTALVALMRREGFDLVIPCQDSTLIPLQQHRRDLEPCGRLYLLDDRAFDVLFDKFKTNELARAVGVRVPREILVTRPEEADRVYAAFAPPVALKPRASFEAQRLHVKQMVRKAYTREDFDAYLNDMLASGPVAVQENIRGEGVGVELLLHAGEPLMMFQHVRVHEPLHGGGSSYRKSVAVSPPLVDAAVKLLRPLAYTGVAMVEFKVDAQTGEWALIEVNARFWGSLPLAIAAGADFPLALFQLLVEGRTAFPRRYRVGLYGRNLRADLGWQWANLRADRSDQTLATRPLRQVLVETFVNLLTRRERSDTFTRDDPRPGFIEVKQLAAEVGTRLSGKLTQRYLRSPVMRRRLERRARDAMGRARTVLFVCKGNVCRSPFAAHVARRCFPPTTTFLSAGSIPRGGRSAPATAVALAARWAVDLSAHRSVVVTEDLVRRADVIVVFDYHNYREIAAAYGFARDRIHFVGALYRDGPLFIKDPWEKDAASFEKTYRQIATALGAGCYRADGVSA